MGCGLTTCSCWAKKKKVGRRCVGEGEKNLDKTKCSPYLKVYLLGYLENGTHVAVECCEWPTRSSESCVRRRAKVAKRKLQFPKCHHTRGFICANQASLPSPLVGDWWHAKRPVAWPIAQECVAEAVQDSFGSNGKSLLIAGEATAPTMIQALWIVREDHISRSA